MDTGHVGAVAPSPERLGPGVPPSMLEPDYLADLMTTSHQG